MHRKTSPECGPKQGSWFRVAALSGLGMMVAILIVVACTHTTEVRRLRHAASRIKIGDSPKEVYAFLGAAELGYECGWPSPGAPPTEYGELYGGKLDYLRDDLESFLHKNLAGLSPHWFSRNLKSWPVRVQYNGSKRVTAVYFDSIQVK